MNPLTHLEVWAKTTPSLFGPDMRYDAVGNLIRFGDYGKRDSQFGWEIDHHPTPKALGGSDHISNLRPLHCKVNASNGGLLGNALNRLSDAKPPQGNYLINALRTRG